MPYPRPTLAELRDSVAGDIRGGLGGVTALLRRSVLAVLGTVLAGALHGLYGFVAWIARQAIPDTADAEHVARWAAMWGIEPIPAVAATGSLTVSGVGAAEIPALTRWRRSDGAEVENPARAVLAAGAAVVPVRAVTPGADGNADAGVAYALVSPLPDVVAAAAVSAPLSGGADAESADALRDRWLTRLRTPPRAGTVADYERWARESSAEITRAWCFPLGANPTSTPPRAGTLGTVQVYLQAAGNAGAAASGVITVTGDRNSVVPAGSLWRSSGGVQYATVAEAAIGIAGQVDVGVVAVAAGSRGNLAPNSDLNRVDAIPGITNARTALGLSGGLDPGIPTAAQVAVASAYIQARRPVTAAVTVSAPTPSPLDVTIQALRPDTVAVRAAIAAEVADLLIREAAPGSAIPISHIKQAISGAEGETDHALTAPVGTGAPPAVVHGAAEIAVPGAVTWT